jgi:chromate reductase, NAD(P)H dehydrogenase (quinone)
MTTLLGLSGALRSASTNTCLMHEAARVFAPDTFVIGDLDLPLYNGDVEDRGIPAGVTRLADQIRAADAVIIATPEYNKALSGVLKNALDWISRVKPGEVWRDKPVAIMSAAGGREGGARAQFSLRLCLTPFRPRLLPGPELMVADSGHAFDAEGRLISDRSRATLAELMAELRAAI